MLNPFIHKKLHRFIKEDLMVLKKIHDLISLKTIHDMMLVKKMYNRKFSKK